LHLDEVQCDPQYEAEERQIQRIYFKGKGKMKVVFSFNRMYEYNHAQSIKAKL